MTGAGDRREGDREKETGGKMTGEGDERGKETGGKAMGGR